MRLQRRKKSTRNTLQHLCPPYLKGTSERIEELCRSLKVKPILKSNTSLGQSPKQVKPRRLTDKVKGVVNEVSCKACDAVYIGETGRNLELRLRENKAAVKRQDKNNGVATRAWTKQHRVNWQ